MSGDNILISVSNLTLVFGLFETKKNLKKLQITIKKKTEWYDFIY
jgi:hypothetical protein